MASKSTSLLRWAGTALVFVATAVAAGPAGGAHADDQSSAPLPAFAPHPSDWQPIFGFQHGLAGQHDDWSAPGVQAAENTVKANLDQSAAFLDPRAHTLFIVNYPDQSQYSPLDNGDSFHHLWYQFTQISDKISQKMVSGVINANIATANVTATRFAIQRCAQGPRRSMPRLRQGIGPRPGPAP